jgi:anti-sigma-K factor RskA
VEAHRAYIESGILELYVMGQLSAPEMLEVERMAATSPEIKRELEAIEIALERYALDNAVEPRQNLFAELEAKLKPVQAEVNPVQQTSFSIQPPPPVAVAQRSNKALIYALAACIGLLVVSGIALINAHSELGKAQQQIIALRTEKDRYASGMNVLKQTNSELQTVADMVEDPNWAIVQLAGTKTSPAAKMMVYWNRKSQDVVLDKSRMKLPENDEAHQYQLWAMVAGKPVDLGVFDMRTDSAQMLLKMKEIAKAEAFAVTLEKRGGSVNPTMDKMVVFAGLSI